MAYNNTYHKKRVQIVLDIYTDWKKKNTDRPDTYFVKNVLPQHSIFMAYVTFITCYKSKLNNNQKKIITSQLSLFA